MEQIIVDYLKYLRIPISENYCKKILLSHPDYPSLLSVSDVLERLGVPCQIGRIQEKDLNRVEFPYLLHLESSRESFVLIKSKDDFSKDHVDLKEWKGVLVKAEPVNTLKDSEQDKAFKEERLIKKAAYVLIGSLLLMCSTLTLYAFSWTNLLLLSLSAVGSVIGFILIAKDLGVTYEPVESFCNTSTRVNCDMILHSEGAKIFSFFSMSDAVLSYFTFQLIVAGLILPLSSIPNPWLWVLALGSALSIPVISYSIFYQAIKAKTWCKLCMMVNGILLVQIAIFGFLIVNGTIQVSDIKLISFLLLTPLFIAIATSLVLIKVSFKKTSEVINGEIAANRVKYDPAVFAHLLSLGQKVDTYDFEKKIVIGNPDAPLQLLMVASLHCYPCKVALKNVLDLLNRYPKLVSVQFIFLLSTEDEIHGIPANVYLIRYWEKKIFSESNEFQKTQELIYDWYDYMETKVFEEHYPKKSFSDFDNKTIIEDQHFKWVRDHKVSQTPTFYVNNYRFPPNYKIKDLASMIPGLLPLVEKQAQQIKEGPRPSEQLV